MRFGQAALTAFGRKAPKLLLHFPVRFFSITVIPFWWYLTSNPQSHSLSHWWKNRFPKAMMGSIFIPPSLSEAPEVWLQNHRRWKRTHPGRWQTQRAWRQHESQSGTSHIPAALKGPEVVSVHVTRTSSAWKKRVWRNPKVVFHRLDTEQVVGYTNLISQICVETMPGKRFVFDAPVIPKMAKVLLKSCQAPWLQHYIYIYIQIYICKTYMYVYIYDMYICILLYMYIRTNKHPIYHVQYICSACTHTY